MSKNNAADSETQEVPFILDLFPALSPLVIVAVLSASADIPDCVDRILALEAQHDCSSLSESEQLKIFEAGIEHPGHNLLANQPYQILLPKNIRTHHIQFNQLHHSDAYNQLYSMFQNYSCESIHSMVAECNGDLDRAAAELLNLHPDTSVRNEVSFKIQTLRQILPHVAENDLACSLERFGSIDSVLTNYLDPFPDTHTNLVRGKSFAAAATSVLDNSLNRTYFESHRGIVENTILKGIPRNSAIMSMNSPNIQLMVQESRNKAAETLIKRNNMFRQAATSFKRGNLTGMGAAAHFAQQGHMFNMQMHESNQNAAELIFRHNQNMAEPNVIDFHGLTVAESEAIVNRNNGDWRRRGKVKIITGFGHHSDGVSRLYPAIWRLFTVLKWKVEVGGNGWFFCTWRP